MTTCGDIISLGLRKAHQVAVGATPAAEESAAGLITLQAMYDEMVGRGAFGRLTEVLATADYTAGENQRIYNNIATPVTITLPETVIDLYTGAARPPRDRSIVVVVGATPGIYCYSAPLGSWARMSSLILTDLAPLAERSVDGLASYLATHLAEEYSDQLGPLTLGSALRFLKLLTHRYDAPATLVVGQYF